MLHNWIFPSSSVNFFKKKGKLCFLNSGQMSIKIMIGCKEPWAHMVCSANADHSFTWSTSSLSFLGSRLLVTDSSSSAVSLPTIGCKHRLVWDYIFFIIHYVIETASVSSQVKTWIFRVRHCPGMLCNFRSLFYTIQLYSKWRPLVIYSDAFTKYIV